MSTVSNNVHVVLPDVHPLEIALDGATCHVAIPEAAVNVT